jgi:RNase P protein component
MKRFISLLVIAGLVFVGGTWGAGEYTDTRNEGRGLELALTARYKEVMTKYDQDRSVALDDLHIAGNKRDGLDQILRAGIETRKFAGAGGAVDRNAIISAVREAYPDLKQLGIYDKIADFVVKMRKSFAASQTQLAGEIQKYNSWRTTGSLLHPLWVSVAGFPSKSLEIKLGAKTFTGAAALDKMSTVVMSGDSQVIFDTSTDKPL